MEAVAGINVGPAVGGEDGPVELDVDIAKAGDVAVGRVADVGVVDQVVKLREAEIASEHDLASLGIERPPDLVEEVGVERTREG
ncbi:hypothetical protein ADL26_19235 [Thermoactinomyces vulgaris]|nr:hypothetical protein ADL26_19235 [Thermoactinomyces vulgaris]